jgi:L-rhamnose mutarotase
MPALLNLLKLIIIILFTSLLSSCKTRNSGIAENDGTGLKKPDLTIGVSDHKNVRRVGMVIKINPERIEEYLAAHADTNPGVRDLLTRYNMRNFSIFMTRLEDGNYYAFGYYEYWGNDFDGDMAKLAAEPRNIEWLKLCDPMQIPVKGNTSWKNMETIFFNY